MIPVPWQGMAAKHLRKLVIVMGEETMTFRFFYLAIVLLC